MTTCRWFLAHSKQTPDEVIDAWVEQSTTRLSSEGVRAIVTSGRDDYMTRSRAMGGWNTWVNDVPVAEDWSGDALFHGIIVPLHDTARPVIGRATQVLLVGFLSLGKYAYAWDVETGALHRIDAVADMDIDSWTDAAWLTLVPA